MVQNAGWNDLNAGVASLLRMHKDVLDGIYSIKWPQPGKSESIELIADENRELRFFLDLRECGKSTSLVLGLEGDRKSTMQNRASDRPLIRLDYADNPSLLRHRNPDGKVITGSHVHLGVSDDQRLPWAFPIGSQCIVLPTEVASVSSLFCAFQDACNITSDLKVDQLLGV